MKKILLAAAVSAAFGISGVQAAEDITVDVAVIGAGVFRTPLKSPTTTR